MQASRPRLLDLPDVLLVDILNILTNKDRGDMLTLAHMDGRQLKRDLPYELLPVSSTCKRLRRLTATLLTDDVDWATIYWDERLTPIFFVDYNLRKKLVKAAFGWYSIAAPALESFHFSRICKALTIPQARYLLTILTKGRAPIRKLYFENPCGTIEHTSTSDELIKQMIPMLQDLLHSSSVMIETLVIENGTPCSLEVMKMICSCDLKNLSYLEFNFGYNIISRVGSLDVEWANNVILHSKRYGANIKTIKIAAKEDQFQNVIDRNSIDFDADTATFHVKSRELITAEQTLTFLSNFQPRIVHFCATMDEKGAEQVLTYFSQQDELTGIYFFSNTFRFILRALSINQQCATKIKGLLQNSFADPLGICQKGLRAMSRYCCNIQQVGLTMIEGCVPDLCEFLKNSKHLKMVRLDFICDLKVEETNLLVTSLQCSSSPIKNLALTGFVRLGPYHVTQIMLYFAETLETLKLYTRKDFSLYSLTCIFRIMRDILSEIDENERMKELDIGPLRWDDEIKDRVPIHLITLKEIRRRFRNLRVDQYERKLRYHQYAPESYDDSPFVVRNVLE